MSSYLEYRSRYRDLLQLVQDQAAMTAAVIAQSGSGQAYLTEELKQSFIDRALDILILLNQMDAKRELSSDDLDELVNDETILEVSIYNKLGQVDRALSTDFEKSQGTSRSEAAWIQEKLAPIINKTSDLLILGVDQREDKFMVAIPRDRGGVIACQLSVEAEQDFKYLTAMESALEDLLHVKGLKYLQLALDDHEPYFVSKDGFMLDESWDRKPLEDILYQINKQDTTLLEVVRPVFFGSSIGEIRIGFEDETLVSLSHQIIYQVLIRTLLLTLLAFAIVIFLISRQNASFLESEKARIEKEVYHLERLNRLREKQAAMGELAAGVAHEIRNPLNAIGMVAQRLKREFDPSEDKEDYDSLTSTMVSEIERINRSLQDFLEYTRPNSLNYSEIDIAELFAQVHQLYGSQALDKGVKLRVKSAHLLFEADADYLRQAITNLVKNALEACSIGQEVKMSAQRDAEIIKIIIEDNGAGIKADQVSRIFDLYYSTKDMGTGVGLALTHKIIADHHGTIQVTSEWGKGSTFEIELPVKA
ncbi:MAG: hypothetical protein K9M55_06590 [Candidatus Marinimicrobia bacterium]|nr:hypothetical protein [Candidatus Neomarinimicrobiota bacterium]MCF7922353.1 hypothetical protein [Candidatus Neomarinimicrobiota bacterium]